MITFSTQVTRIRWTEQGDERVEFPARFLPEGRILLPKDSDIDEGDMIEEIESDGHKRTFRLSEIQFMNAGWGTGALDHTEAHLEPVADRPAVAERAISISGLHSAVSAAAGGLFDDGHYEAAISEALKMVEERVKRFRTGTQERDALALLIEGATQVLGDPRSAGNQPAEALEYLALASMVMRRLDIAEDRPAFPEG